MPQVPFESLPGNARVWVFGASRALPDKSRDLLLVAIDQHLQSWQAHGTPLVCARDFRDHRFLAIGVDEAATGASGCSIDGLFRVLVSLEQTLGASLVGGGMVFWRNEHHEVQGGTRAEFTELAQQGRISGATRVFDVTVGSAGDWVNHFERSAAESWHARLLAGVARM